MSGAERGCAFPGCTNSLQPKQREFCTRCSNRLRKRAQREREQATRPVEDELVTRLANVTTEWARKGGNGWEALEVAVWPTQELLERLT